MFQKHKLPDLLVGWMWRTKARGCQGGPSGPAQTPEWTSEGPFEGPKGTEVAWGGRRGYRGNIRSVDPSGPHTCTKVLDASEISQQRRARVTWGEPRGTAGLASLREVSMKVDSSPAEGETDWRAHVK